MLEAQEKAIAAFARKAARSERGGVYMMDNEYGYFITDGFTAVMTAAKPADVVLSDHLTFDRSEEILDDFLSGGFYEVDGSQDLQSDLVLLKRIKEKPVLLRSDGSLSSPISEAFDGVKIQKILKMAGKNPAIKIGGEYFQRRYWESTNQHRVLMVTNWACHITAFLMPLSHTIGATSLPLSPEKREELKKKPARQAPTSS